MFVIVQATTTLDLYRVGADIEQGINWDYDTDSDVDDDDDKDETFNASGGKSTSRRRPSKRPRRGEASRGGGSRRSAGAGAGAGAARAESCSPRATSQPTPPPTTPPPPADLPPRSSSPAADGAAVESRDTQMAEEEEVGRDDSAEGGDPPGVPMERTPFRPITENTARYREETDKAGDDASNSTRASGSPQAPALSSAREKSEQGAGLDGASDDDGGGSMEGGEERGGNGDGGQQGGGGVRNDKEGDSQKGGKGWVELTSDSLQFSQEQVQFDGDEICAQELEEIIQPLIVNPPPQPNVKFTLTLRDKSHGRVERFFNGATVNVEIVDGEAANSGKDACVQEGANPSVPVSTRPLAQARLCVTRARTCACANLAPSRRNRLIMCGECVAGIRSASPHTEPPGPESPASTHIHALEGCA